MAKEFDLIVIGAGSGGLVAASGAAKLGASVALIERRALGGDCLYYGCVPSKTLIRVAKVASLMRRGPEFGLPSFNPGIDIGKVLAHMHGVQEQAGKHDKPEKFEAEGVHVFLGEASFVSRQEIKVNNETLKGKKFIIATGSRARAPPIPGLEEAGYINNEKAFELKKLPESIVIVGGGPIGMEFSQVFQRFGVNVTVVEKSAHVLSREDEDIALELQSILEKEGIRFLTNAAVEKVEKRASQKIVQVSVGDKKMELVAEEVMIAIGRAPNVENLGLEKAGVEYGKRGIPVNPFLQTSQPHIYAIGDVNGAYPFTHMAAAEAGVAVGNALLPVKRRISYAVAPWTTFTDPEVARVGMNEAEAKQKGLKYKVYRHGFGDVDRALAEVEAHGFVKILAAGFNGKIIGATILGPDAGNLLPEITLAMNKGLTVGDVAGAIHVYPTLSMAVSSAASNFYREKLFKSKIGSVIKFIVKIFN